MVKRKLIYLSILVLFAGLIPVQASFAKSGDSATAAAQKQMMTQENQKQAEKELKQEMEKFENLREPVIQSASSALDDVLESMSLIRDKKYKDAMNKLQQADGKLDTAIAAEPDLSFITVESEIEIFRMLDVPSLEENNQRIKRDLAFAEELLEDGNVQAARTILMDMRDEIVITNTSLPMATYPAAIKEAVAELADGEHDEALATLDTAMNTLVTTETLIPLPIYNARKAVGRASNMDKTQKEKVLATLDFARMELKQAELLGYLHEDSEAYESIEERIEELIEEIKGENMVEKYYGKLKTELNELWQDIISI